VWVSRLVTAGLMLLAATLMFLLTTAGEAFNLLLSIGAGTGLLYLLRWFWWRINAWSEIAAMVSSFAAAVVLFAAKRSGVDIPAHLALLGSVAFTTVVWIVVTYLTPPVEREVLIRFCRLVRPAGPGWRVLRQAAGVGPAADNIPQALLGWVLGCMFVYSALFGAGSFLYGRTTTGIVYVALFALSGILLARLLSAIWRRGPADASAEAGPAAH
jgi:SSS family solute:Na+ symporter